MRNGQCPKCHSTTIYSRTDGVYFYRSSLFVDTGKKELIPMNVHYVSYLCTTCGYFENYVAEPGALAKVMSDKNWQKVLVHAA